MDYVRGTQQFILTAIILATPTVRFNLINSLRHKAYSTCRTLFFYLNIETKQHSVVVSHCCTPYEEIIGLSVVPTT